MPCKYLYLRVAAYFPMTENTKGACFSLSRVLDSFILFASPAPFPLQPLPTLFHVPRKNKGWKEWEEKEVQSEEGN